MRKGGLEPTKKAHITSYLDALRGWAAVIVFNHHYGKIWILNHDFLRILVHGRAMVDVFFVISGYVLSYRMLKLMRTQQAVPLLDTVVSSVFRRWIRLYGSAAVASFILMLLVEFGWTYRSRRQKNLALQLWDWGLDFGHFSNVFAHLDGYWSRNGLSNKYLDVLWTMPVEFRGSMALFTFCVGVCKLSTRNRMLLCWFLMLLAWYWAVVYVALFLGGLFLADLSFTRHPERLGPHPSLPLDAKDVLEHPPRRQPVSKRYSTQRR
jgi:peptidoglycan/LPS O-acetylase OafA/YrhL